MSAWTRSSAAYCRWPCFGRRVGLDDPQRSFPTPTILWFCEEALCHFLLHPCLIPFVISIWLLDEPERQSSNLNPKLQTVKACLSSKAFWVTLQNLRSLERKGINCSTHPLRHSSECVSVVQEPVTGCFLCSKAFALATLNQPLQLLELNLKLWICSITRHFNEDLTSIWSGEECPISFLPLVLLNAGSPCEEQQAGAA